MSKWQCTYSSKRAWWRAWTRDSSAAGDHTSSTILSFDPGLWNWLVIRVPSRAYSLFKRLWPTILGWSSTGIVVVRPTRREMKAQPINITNCGDYRKGWESFLVFTILNIFHWGTLLKLPCSGCSLAWHWKKKKRWKSSGLVFPAALYLDTDVGFEDCGSENESSSAPAVESWHLHSSRKGLASLVHVLEINTTINQNQKRWGWFPDFHTCARRTRLWESILAWMDPSRISFINSFS